MAKIQIFKYIVKFIVVFVSICLNINNLTPLYLAALGAPLQLRLRSPSHVQGGFGQPGYWKHHALQWCSCFTNSLQHPYHHLTNLQVILPHYEAVDINEQHISPKPHLQAPKHWKFVQMSSYHLVNGLFLQKITSNIHTMNCPYSLTVGVPRLAFLKLGL